MKKHFTIRILSTIILVVAMNACKKDSTGSGNGGGGNSGGIYNGHYEYVDLGLPSGTLWATFNLGADRPESIGDCFQWGETAPNNKGRNKHYYDGSAYDDDSGWTKYCNNPNFGYHDYRDDYIVLEPEDDAATVNWGNNWRTPTQEEWMELFENTNFIMTTYNGVYGALLTASNGKTLFLPAYSPYIDSPTGGLYWSSTHGRLSWEYPHNAYPCYFYHQDSWHGDLYTIYHDEHRGTLLCIRPVRDKNGSANGHAYVDLGLPSGTLWATCNVGSNIPEGCGTYFAWGETTAKSTYTWNNYKHCRVVPATYPSEIRLTKYCDSDLYGYNGFTDNLKVLESIDDAASVLWGSGWCIPSIDNWDELRQNTTIQWTTINGVNGHLFTGNTGKSIFIPAAGHYDDNILQQYGDSGYYWTNMQRPEWPLPPIYTQSIPLNSDSQGFSIYYSEYRYFGNTIRPVRVKH